MGEQIPPPPAGPSTPQPAPAPIPPVTGKPASRGCELRLTVAPQAPAAAVQLTAPAGPLEIVLHDPRGGAVVGRWQFPGGGAVLEINTLWPELCRLDGERAEVETVDPDFIPWPRLTFLVNGARNSQAVSTKTDYLSNGPIHLTCGGVILRVSNFRIIAL